MCPCIDYGAQKGEKDSRYRPRIIGYISGYAGTTLCHSCHSPPLPQIFNSNAKHTAPMMNTANTDTVQTREQRVTRETPQQVMMVIPMDLKV